MDSEFLERIQRMKLTVDEDEAMIVRRVRRQEILEEYSLGLIGQFLTTKSINLRAAKNLLRSMWKLGDDLKIVDVSDGILQFKFSMESQLSKPINVETENQGNESQWHQQIDSDFSNSKVTPTESVISSNLIEVVVMDEDTVILNRDLMGKQGEQISPLGFEGLEIGFKVGCGNVQGNKNTGKGQPKRSDNQDKDGSQSLNSPKNVESMEESTIGSPITMRNWKRLTTRSNILINGSVINVEPGNKRKQAENLIKEAAGVMRKKKDRIVENEQGVVPTMGSMEVAGQPCRV